jgi:hypothetical protein
MLLSIFQRQFVCPILTTCFSGSFEIAIPTQIVITLLSPDFFWPEWTEAINRTIS